MSVKIAERLQRVRPYGERRVPLGPGIVWFSNPDLGTGLCFPLQKLGYRVRLSGPTGAVEAFLTFSNPTAQPQQATFLFPLDRGVAPVKIRGKAGSRQFETEVGPAPVDDSETENQASVPPELCKVFAEETEHVMAIPLGEIPAGGEVSFQMLLAYMATECGEEGLGFSFRLPLLSSKALSTLNPDDAGQTELARGLERGAQVAISLQIEASDLEPGKVSTSQVCGVARSPNGDLAIEYDRRKPLDARDFIVDYQLWRGNRPKAWLRSQGRHFLLNFLPPATPTPSNPRRLVILVDGSEEMAKVGPTRCQECLSFLLKNLDQSDRFALVAFNREVSGYKNGDFVEAELAGEALKWLKEYQFTGAADLKELLRRVITLPRQPDSVLSVILVSAGRIGNEPELYRLLQGSRDILRLFPIMLGSKTDPHFARAAARLTGGYAFRALTAESVSRAAERVLEHTRQPVLEGVGFQDKGLQYQGESLTPKYPSGLNWRRPITVMGAHAGRGGLEAGGTGPGGTAWTEFLELKPVFHKVLANVWAHVKATELDDEAQMLNRAERGILQKVIMNLSREFGLLNRYTAVTLKTSDGKALLTPAIDASRWYKQLGLDTVKGKSANELLEEQRSQKELKGGLSKQRTPGRGLKMKEVLGSKATAAVFGSKLGHRNKLSGNVKEGLFSKPMLRSRGTGTTTVAGKPMMGRRGGRTVSPPPPTTPPKPLPVSPVELPEPTQALDVRPGPTREPERTQRLPDMPTTRLEESNGFHEAPPGIGDATPQGFEDSGKAEKQPSGLPELGKGPSLDSAPSSPDASSTIDSSLAIGLDSLTSSPGDGPQDSGDLSVPKIGQPPGMTPPPPTAPPPPTISKTPAVSMSDELSSTQEPEVELPTPRQLAAKVTSLARQGPAEERARNALKAQPELRQSLMSEMRTLHGSLGATNDPERLMTLTNGVLARLAEVAPNSELLVRAYGLGYQARGMIQGDLDEAKGKLKFWLSRFAKLF